MHESLYWQEEGNNISLFSKLCLQPVWSRAEIVTLHFDSKSPDNIY